MIREQVECFVPVIQNQTDYLIHTLLLNNTFSSEYYFKDRPNFSFSRVEYIDVIPELQSLSVLLGRTVFSLASSSQALVTDTFTINNRQLLEIQYKSALYFNTQEDLSTLIEVPGQTEINLNLVYRYFRKPKQIISNSVLETRLSTLRQNKNYIITKFTDKFYEFNNVIIVIINKITQRKETYFVQEDNRTAILL